jgi:ABC-type dipeptide/oligopeptide/nickel transport system ATPase component
MRHGKVMEQGLTGDVFDSPKTEYGRLLMSSVPRLKTLATLEEHLDAHCKLADV